MRKLFIYLCILFSSLVYADSYWVSFTDKKSTSGTLNNPLEYLSARAIERRQKQSIAIDSLDLPVSSLYVDSLQKLGCRVDFVSRWLNGVTVEIDDNDNLPDVLRKLDFVSYIERTRITSKSSVNALRLSNKNKYKIRLGEKADSTDTQTQQLNLNLLHEAGYKGKGILMAIIDDGFNGVDKLEAFANARERIVATHDFVNPADMQDVYCTKNPSQGDHGTMVFSTIAAITEGYTGNATEADYILLRSEDDIYENLREVDALVAAFEYADSAGVDICSSSLGYLDMFDDATTNPTYQQMDGRTMRSSVAATIAARKGMLMCVAAGNEGDVEWHYIDSPADADSILTVGAVDKYGHIARFSSYGPSADGRLKPEVCALGSKASIISVGGNIRTSNGTSFSTPIMAGAAACLWSALPDLSNMQIRERICMSASMAQEPNNRMGYGVPDMWKVYQNATNQTDVINQPIFNNQVEWFDLLGNRYLDHKSLHQGIYIMSNGKTKKKILIR